MIKKMREIIFDTETTGLSPADGDRIIEIGAVEMQSADDVKTRDVVEK